jgi:unsaturated rhamnogalacturonyl hydrolase
MRLQVFVVSALIPVWASMTQLAVAQPAQPPAFSADLTHTAVRRVMTRAADWQLAHPSEHAPYDWTVAGFYTGVMALSNLSDSPKYYDAMKAMGKRNQWRPGLSPGLADDYAVIATYAKIYQREKDKKILAPALALFDFLVTRPYNEPLTWGNGIEMRE